MGSSKNIYE